MVSRPMGFIDKRVLRPEVGLRQRGGGGPRPGVSRTGGSQTRDHKTKAGGSKILKIGFAWSK